MTRILLRLQLAPERERKFKANASAAAKRKQDEKEQEGARSSKPMSKSLYKSKVLDLCNELAEVENMPASDRRSTRMNGILRQLRRLTRQTVANDKTMGSALAAEFLDMDEIEALENLGDVDDIGLDPLNSGQEGSRKYNRRRWLGLNENTDGSHVD